MDLQIARVRVVAPQPLDFAALADGIVRNNVGVGAIRFHATAAIEPARASGAAGEDAAPRDAPHAAAPAWVVRLEPTKQLFPLAAAPAPETPAQQGTAAAGAAPRAAEPARWRRFEVLRFDQSGAAALRPIDG